jgi:hypothetical protein
MAGKGPHPQGKNNKLILKVCFLGGDLGALFGQKY